LASRSSDSTIKLWQISDGSLLRVLSSPSDEILRYIFSPDGQMLAAALENRTVKIWKVSDGTLITTITGFTNWINILAFSADGKTLAAADYNDKGKVSLWNIPDGTLKIEINGEFPSDSGYTHFSVYAEEIVFLPDNERVVLSMDALASKTVFYMTNMDTNRRYEYKTGIHDASNGALEQTLMSGNGQQVHLMKLSSDGKYIILKHVKFFLWGEGGNGLHLMRIDDAKELRSVDFVDEYASIYAAYSPDSSIAAMGAADNTVKLWNTSDGSPLRILEGHVKPVYFVSFSPNGDVLASASADNTIKLWQVADGTLIKTIEAYINWGGDVIFTPDAKTMLINHDGLISLWGVKP